MLLNNGHDPYTNESIIPSDVVEHVAYGRSVSQGKPKFPELVCKCFVLSNKRDLTQRDWFLESQGIRSSPMAIFISKSRPHRAWRE